MAFDRILQGHSQQV